MRKDAQFFRRDAEIEREVWLTSAQLQMNQNPRKQIVAPVLAVFGRSSQSPRRVNAVDWKMPNGQSSVLFARAIGLTRKIDVINLAA
ncbi:MAG TPA: hypothetical protein VIL70_04695 [Chthoniobacterales bacterium]